MTEPRRPFVKISDAMWEDPDVQSWGPAAELALLRAVQWSHRNDSDGFVPTRTWVAIVADLTTIDPDPVDTLTSAEQLVPMAGGHLIVKYGAWQQRSEDRFAKLSNARRKGGKARAATAARDGGRFAPAGDVAGSSAGERKRRSRQHEPSTPPAPATSSGPAPPGKRPEARGQRPPELGLGSTEALPETGVDLAPAPAELVRRRDLGWEAFVEVCNIEPDELSTERRNGLNGMLRSLKNRAGMRGFDASQQATEIRRRAANCPYGAVTPERLVQHWAEWGSPPAQAAHRPPPRDNAQQIADRFAGGVK